MRCLLIISLFLGVVGHTGAQGAGTEVPIIWPTVTPWSPPPLPTAIDGSEDGLTTDFDVALEANARTQSEVNKFEGQVVADDNQLYIEGQAVLVDEEAGTREMMGYVKFMFSGAGATQVFGPFAPVMVVVGVFILITFLFGALYYGQLIISVVFDISRFVIQWIIKFIPGVG